MIVIELFLCPVVMVVSMIYSALSVFGCEGVGWEAGDVLLNYIQSSSQKHTVWCVVVLHGDQVWWIVEGVIQMSRGIEFIVTVHCS